LHLYIYNNNLKKSILLGTLKKLHLREQEHVQAHDLSKVEGQPAVAEDWQEGSDIVPFTHIFKRLYKF
jgi:hypothetical protein